MDYHKHFKLNSNSMLRYIAFTLFIASTIAAELKPNYDKNQFKFFDPRLTTPLLLKCDGGNGALTWQKDGKDVKQIEGLKNRVEIHEKENNLIIKDTTPEDAGKYTCSIPGKGISADIEVIATAYLKKIPDYMAVVEGEKLQIHCVAFGTNPIITWMIGNDTVTNGSRVKLQADEHNINDAILVIDHAELTDRNFYNCTANNEATEHGLKNFEPQTESTYVRVKGKYAALWPFLGICAEVIILCAIILVYEKRRNKEGLDDSDTDQSPEQEKLKTGK